MRAPGPFGPRISFLVDNFRASFARITFNKRAILKNMVSTQILISLVLSLCSWIESQAAASIAHGIDSHASLSTQSYPLGGMLTGDIGYGQKFWSAEPDSADTLDSNASPNWHYGYLHPDFELKTTAVTNRLTGAIEFYPISIFGLSAGGGADFSNYNRFSGLDCSRIACEKTLMFQFLQAKFIGGIGKFFLVATGRYDSYYTHESVRPFYDYMSYLVGRPGHDDLRSLTLLSLYRLNITWAFGAVGIFQQMVLSHGNNAEVVAVGNYTSGPLQLSAGIGEYHSDHQPLKPAALMLLTYTFNRSIGLLP